MNEYKKPVEYAGELHPPKPLPMPNKYYLRHDRTAVKPEMDKPEWETYDNSHKWTFNRLVLEWDNHIKSLPALDVDPDYLKTLRPGWFEGEERYEVYEYGRRWIVVDKDKYDSYGKQYRRLTIVAPQEAEKDLRVTGVVQDVDRTALEFDKIRSEIALVGKKCIQCGKEFTDRSGGSYCSIQCWDAHCLHGVPHLEQPATPQPVTGAKTKEEIADDYTGLLAFKAPTQLHEAYLSAMEAYATQQAASRPSDAVDADFTLWVVVNKWQYKETIHRWVNYYIGEFDGMALTHSELYQLFKSKQSTP